MSITGTPAKVNGEWGGVRVAKGVGQPGAVVTVQTKAGKTWTKQLVGVAQSYDDSDIWTAEDVGNNGSSPPAPAGPPAAPAPSPAPASTGPAGAGGRVTASELLTVWKLAYGDLIQDESIGPEQASSGAGVIAIAVQRGVANDLDPFGG